MRYIFIFLAIVSFFCISCENIRVNNQKNNEIYNDSTLIENDSIKTDEEERKDGDWIDQVGLSQDSVMFNSEEDSIVIATKYITWWLRSFTFYETSDISSKKVIIHVL